MARCGEEEPALVSVGGRLVACHLYDAAGVAPLAASERVAAAS
jgi:hypothetical protein